MPVLVIAVVAFIIFNVMLVLFVTALVSEQKQQHRELESRSRKAKGTVA